MQYSRYNMFQLNNFSLVIHPPLTCIRWYKKYQKTSSKTFLKKCFTFCVRCFRDTTKPHVCFCNVKTYCVLQLQRTSISSVSTRWWMDGHLSVERGTTTTLNLDSGRALSREHGNFTLVIFYWVKYADFSVSGYVENLFPFDGKTWNLFRC